MSFPFYFYYIIALVQKYLHVRCQSADVLADDVELYIYKCAYFDVVEIGVLECVRNYAHLESVVGRGADGEAHSVDCHRTFVDGDVAASCHSLVELVLEGEYVASLRVFN